MPEEEMPSERGEMSIADFLKELARILNEKFMRQKNMMDNIKNDIDYIKQNDIQEMKRAIDEMKEMMNNIKDKVNSLDERTSKTESKVSGEILDTLKEE